MRPEFVFACFALLGWVGWSVALPGRYCFVLRWAFFGVVFRRAALETPEWTSRDLNHHRQSVSAGKTNAIPTEPSGRLFCSERG